jgi:hypothetical protein
VLLQGRSVTVVPTLYLMCNVRVCVWPISSLTVSVLTCVCLFRLVGTDCAA